MGRLIGQGRRFATLLGLAIACAASGCVERRYTIRTEPPGAYVIVNGEEIGPTPVSRSFVYHGDRDITLMLDGYQTQRIIQPMNAPWWDNLATEFFTENLIPYTFRDEHEYIYRMEPATVPATNDLVARGESLRSESKVPPKPRRTGILGYFGF